MVNLPSSGIAALLLLSVTLCAQEPADHLAQWIAAVKAHQAGNPGKVALGVATWAGADIEPVIVEAKRYARSIERVQPGQGNDLLLRGAAMHADIARLIPNEFTRRSARQRSIYVVNDGRDQGTRYLSIHWELGRSLLEGVSPKPAGHPGVLRWYQETSVDLLRLRSLAEAAVHLPISRQLFPSDPVLLYWSGVLHERFSSAALQAAAQAVVVENRGATSVASMRAELTRAERFFRATLVVSPDHQEARVRLGRVLGELGQYEQSADVLRAAVAAGVTGDLLYLAELFLAKQEDALGHSAEARAHLERAAALYPRAQSPRLALSQLSRRMGDRPGAQRELRILVDLPDTENQREDPWWKYYDAR